MLLSTCPLVESSTDGGLRPRATFLREGRLFLRLLITVSHLPSPNTTINAQYIHIVVGKP